MKLLHKDRDLGWTPYIWLVYLVFLIPEPYNHHAHWPEWTALTAGTIAFVFLYLKAFSLKGRNLAGAMLVMMLFGIAFAPFNAGAAVFFIYAASFAGFAGDAGSPILMIAAIVTIAGLESWWFSLPPQFWVITTLFSGMVGGANIHFAQRDKANRKLRLAQEEIEHLAKVAERERIARDLHDVLGHTLSVIILKSELARKLVNQDPETSAKEMSEVEQISREALSEVRLAIGGYRASGLADEFERAKQVLTTAGIHCDFETGAVTLSAAQETVLSLVVREAVTNIVRHSHAQNCRLSLRKSEEGTQLVIADDGRGGDATEGNGLRGMRDRIEALDGRLQHDSKQGTTLTIELPEFKRGAIQEMQQA